MKERVKAWFDRYTRLVEWFLTLFPGKWLAGVAIAVLVGLAIVLPFIESKSDSLGWYGVALGIFGFWYTASQLYLTKRESEAAKNAADAANRKAEETIRQLREEAARTQQVLQAQAAAESYRRLVEWASYFVEEAIGMWDVRQWKIVTRRLRDASRQLREIQIARRHANERWATFARDLEQYADRLLQSARDNQRLPDDFPVADWGPLTGAVRSALIEEKAGIRPEVIE